MFDTIKVAKRIRDGRNAKNMTQMELADKLGVSFQAVSNWERGASMPDISKLSDLSEILSISISDLLGSEDKSSISVEKVIENLLYFIHIGSDIQLISRKNQFDGDGFLFTGTFKGGSGIPDHAVDVKGGFLKHHAFCIQVV